MFGWVRKQARCVKVDQHAVNRRRNPRRRPPALESLEGRISLSGLSMGTVQVVAVVSLQEGNTPIVTREGIVA